MPSPNARTIANLTSFVVNVPADAVRFVLATRTAMQADDLVDVDAAKMLEGQAPEDFAAHCVLQAQQWTETGGGHDTQFTCRYVDAGGHGLTTYRFRMDNNTDSQTYFDGSGEGLLREVMGQNAMLLEFNLKSQKLVSENYGALMASMMERMRMLERKLGVSENTNDDLRSVVRNQDDDDDDNERFDRMVGAVVEVAKGLKSGSAATE